MAAERSHGCVCAGKLALAAGHSLVPLQQRRQLRARLQPQQPRSGRKLAQKHRRHLTSFSRSSTTGSSSSPHTDWE